MRIEPVIAIVCFCMTCAASCSRATDAEPGASSTPEASASSDQPKSGASQDSGRSTADSPAAPELAHTPQLLTTEQTSQGWVCLFDGQTLFGWEANSGANWSVADGVIRADLGNPGLLVTTTAWADFELQLEYRLEVGGNSGVFLRTSFDPQDPTTDCYELNLCDSHPEFPTGSIVGRSIAEADVDGEGSWKSLHLRVEGARIEAQLDRRPVIEFRDTSPRALPIGFIGLQMNGGRIEFRNLFLRPLRLEPISGGDDLSGWREVPGSKSRFEVAEGTIHVIDGPGFVETEGTWANFVLQARARINGKHLNSGIFFRAMTGTETAPSNGYELQIHNGFEGGARSEPIDFGTGAIFRRQKARWVVADDNQWFTVTLVADGDHFSSWVDGVQVTDWTDDRAAHENPRRGKRLAAGHISLQGHDPTTDLKFSDLRIVELPETD